MRATNGPRYAAPTLLPAPLALCDHRMVARGRKASKGLGAIRIRPIGIRPPSICRWREWSLEPAWFQKGLSELRLGARVVSTQCSSNIRLRIPERSAVQVARMIRYSAPWSRIPRPRPPSDRTAHWALRWLPISSTAASWPPGPSRPHGLHGLRPPARRGARIAWGALRSAT